MAKKILFLYAGGTIGQMPKTVSVNGESKEIFYPPETDGDFRTVCEPVISQVSKDRDLEVTFELVTTKDSSNMTPADWQLLVERIAKAQDDEGYDAVGIAHGTDTLSYTATALSLGLHGSDPSKSGLSIPVVLTGAQNSLHVNKGDGRFNLYNLFLVLAEAVDREVADVLISFWNRVLLGCRTSKVSEKDFDAYQSLSFPDVGVINALGVTLQPHFTRRKSDASYQIRTANAFGGSVTTFEIFPGLHPENILKYVETCKTDALIFRTYGPGHIPFIEDYDFESLIREVTDTHHVPVIVATKFAGGTAGAPMYDVGVRAVEAGAIQSLDHTNAAIEVKAQWLIGNELFQSVEGFKKVFHTSYAGEVTV
ncbi:asparaginase domain-containing protein [Candidatus Pacebacteria bacterium]|nr:asparaginase domain-containing protein [Candidatus Paceibacterota bacterium]